MGADALARLIERIDFDEEEEKLRAAIDPQEGQRPLSAQRKQKAIKRLKIVSAFNRRDEHGRRVNDPRAMILEVVPVIPPELRPMVQLDGGRFATSDLNDLYRRVINRNNRLSAARPGCPRSSSTTRSVRCRKPSTLFDNGRRAGGHRPGTARLASRHAQGQAGSVPPEPARARRLLRCSVIVVGLTPAAPARPPKSWPRAALS
jgi:DNA-directed RNA polymerase beta' subunit